MLTETKEDWNKRQGGMERVLARERDWKSERTYRRGKRQAGIASVAVNKQGHEVAGFRSTRKVYGTQRHEITSRKHARLRHPNGYETCVCAHILRVSSPIATKYWYHSGELRPTNLTHRAIVFDRILEIYYNIVLPRCKTRECSTLECSRMGESHSPSRVSKETCVIAWYFHFWGYARFE